MGNRLEPVTQQLARAARLLPQGVTPSPFWAKVLGAGGQKEPGGGAGPGNAREAEPAEPDSLSETSSDEPIAVLGRRAQNA
jgi:hypothetical protein